MNNEKRKHEQIYENIWKLALGKMYADWRRGGGKATQDDIAEKTGLTQKTVSRYLAKYEEGPEEVDRLSLIDTIKILHAYNVEVRELIEATGDPEVGYLIHQFLQRREFSLKLAAIVGAGGRAADMIEAQVDFIYEQLMKGDDKK